MNPRAFLDRCAAQARLHLHLQLPRGFANTAQALVLGTLLGGALNASAATTLADSPVFATSAVPGNVALALSVEWPTAVRTAHTDTTYTSTTTYLGYFDPDKCYLYHSVASETATDLNHFYPNGTSTTRNCTGAGQWSGNYLNWASTPTIDPFRWAMTGGYRVIDTTTETILQKARHSGQGSLTPDKSVTTSSTTAGATPFSGSIHSRIQGLGIRMRIASSASRLGNTVAAYTSAVTTMADDRAYDVYMRVKVCDPSATAGGPETNCKQYGSNWKPEGLIQKYSNRIRFSAFGYLNDLDMLRDGGVLRAQQKFVGPRRPVPGEPDVANTLSEWDPSTGVFFTNPDSTDADQTNTDFGPSVAVTNSGVMNYLNKFGQLNNNNYKEKDPVSELYYTALRYFKNQGSVPEYTTMPASTATRTTFLDGFPAITRWNDPIQYSCQRNFILGIGDIYTHRDKNLPGNTGTTEEPAKPASVSGDTTVNAETMTNSVFALEGLAAPNVNNYSGRNNSAGIAGLAYYANTTDIRPTVAGNPATDGKQTIQTYWVDVLENPFVASNQFYLAAKYGGFTVPEGYDPATRSTALPLTWWSTTGEMVGAQNRPDNYYTAGRPDTMVAGLTNAFERISAASIAFTTSFSTSVPQVALTGNGSYGAQYNPSNWSGEVVASELTFDAATGTPTLQTRWTATGQLATQLGGTGWDIDRNVITWNGTTGAPFRATSPGTTGRLTVAQLAALDTSYRADNDSADYLNYLRGDRTHEQASTATGSTHAYRTRTQLLGDIVGSRARPVGPPSLPLSDATNPGYSAFRTLRATRPTVVYVGANDGMLHAFNGALTGTDAGREIFAYVPNAVFNGPDNTPGVNGLASLGRSPLNHRYLVNATPTSYDIDMNRTGTGSTPATTAAEWHSVLIGGLGKGGRSYYAIDVTNPLGITNEATAAANVLWEFTAPEMGYTFGEPMVVKTRKYGWTVIFPSGYNTPDGQGYLFFVNPRTGVLLEPPVPTGVGSVANDAGLAHANAYVVDFTDGYADAVYAGDLLGNLWRFDLTGASGRYPAPLRLATLSHPVDGAQPVTSRPIMELHPRTRKRVVMLGTGRLLDPSDIGSTKEQSFYAIEDGNAVAFNTTLPAGITFPIDRGELVANTNLLAGYTATTASPMGWYLDLGKNASNNVAWRLVSDATSFFGTVAFAPTLPNGDVCSPSGISRIYGVDYSNGLSKLTQNSTVVSYVPGGTGVITDLRFLSVDGKVRLIGGSDRGAVQNVPGNFGSTIGLKRLNWRELPLSN